MKTFVVRAESEDFGKDIEVEADSEDEALSRAENLCSYSMRGMTSFSVLGEKPKPQDEPKKEMKRFMVTVHEEFSAVYSVEARDVAEARAIVEEGFNSDAEDYSPSRDGEGYRRHVYIDPDFSD